MRTRRLTIAARSRLICMRMATRDITITLRILTAITRAILIIRITLITIVLIIIMVTRGGRTTGLIPSLSGLILFAGLIVSMPFPMIVFGILTAESTPLGQDGLGMQGRTRLAASHFVLRLAT